MGGPQPQFMCPDIHIKPSQILRACGWIWDGMKKYFDELNSITVELKTLHAEQSDR